MENKKRTQLLDKLVKFGELKVGDLVKLTLVSRSRLYELEKKLEIASVNRPVRGGQSYIRYYKFADVQKIIKYLDV